MCVQVAAMMAQAEASEAQAAAAAELAAGVAVRVAPRLVATAGADSGKVAREEPRAGG